MDSFQQERLRVNFSWLLKLRWAAAGGQLLTIAAARVLFSVEVPLAPLLGLVGVTALTNAALEGWFHRRRSEAWPDAGELLPGSVMVFDLLLLSGMLYLAGGIANPFALFYLVNLALAAVILRTRWSWALAALAAVCCAYLANRFSPVPALGHGDGLRLERLFSSKPLEPAEMRLTAVLVALLVASAIVVYFITRLSAELQARDLQLVDAKQRKERDERLASLATLAAGAAHELSSPLGTIAVVARELERSLQKAGASEGTVEDARLVRTEVGRCRAILDRMSADAGVSVGDQLVRIDVEGIVEEMQEGLADLGQVSFRIEASAEDLEIRLPLSAVGQTLRALLKNALDASVERTPVEVTLSRSENRLLIDVVDSGSGMSEETLLRVSEPFFTTKEPGRGMGLGLYLGRTVIERLDGSLTLQSVLGEGTRARVTLPLDSREVST